MSYLKFWSSYVSGGYGQGAGAGFNSLQPPGSPPPPPPPPPPGRNDPYFDAMTPRNVTALVGKSAYLTCRVRNLGNKTVSWIRHRDIHILTVGGYTYTSDQRFQANHHRDNEEWTLQIKWAQKRDAGIYECQISTQPVRSYFVNLNIVDAPPMEAPRRLNDDVHDNGILLHQMIRDEVPTAQILGGPDLHVDKGSTINLTCIIKYSPEPPAYIFWYHHDEVISYDSSRGGVSVITEKGEVTTSYLLIQHAELSDSGKYSCSPSNADVASVRVHVLNGGAPEGRVSAVSRGGSSEVADQDADGTRKGGRRAGGSSQNMHSGERPAAMQTGSAGLSNSSLNIVTLILLCLLYSFLLEEVQLNDASFCARLRER
ncbi:zwei Ig domain protein zig-8 [Anabrus simplex]|uniref:zwei Ig domain protein zig-8 n=1 Tax=Anabrus simplex TaxID=316456 RepID=UPI0035A33906